MQGLNGVEAGAAIAAGVNVMLAAQTTARICLLQVLGARLHTTSDACSGADAADCDAGALSRGALPDV